MIRIKDFAGSFAENKDVARKLREQEILPAIKQGRDVILDFSEVEGATQSFIHALISDIIRQHGAAALDKLEFRNCSETIKKIISIVVDYMQVGV